MINHWLDRNDKVNSGKCFVGLDLSSLQITLTLAQRMEEVEQWQLNYVLRIREQRTERSNQNEGRQESD